MTCRMVKSRGGGRGISSGLADEPHHLLDRRVVDALSVDERRHHDGFRGEVAPIMIEASSFRATAARLIASIRDRQESGAQDGEIALVNHTVSLHSQKISGDASKSDEWSRAGRDRTKTKSRQAASAACAGGPSGTHRNGTFPVSGSMGAGGPAVGEVGLLDRHILSDSLGGYCEYLEYEPLARVALWMCRGAGVAAAGCAAMLAMVHL